MEADSKIVVIGASTGGLKALQTLLSALTSEFPLPIAIAQHRGADSESLIRFLGGSSRLPVKEPEDKEPIEAGNVYLAPRDYHLLIDDGSFALSTESPVAYARPSIDVLFESASDQYQDRVIGVILTGANRDGARGLQKIKAAGGLAIVESPDSAKCREMPDAAIAITAVDWVLPLEEIGRRLDELTIARVTPTVSEGVYL
ncbi:MAG TPA: chemotaxis protein CheB [Pyrinomonadaceae bacterium]|nr:chemotaxis protein CheB [Pyrinomonadaceae bacterium]